MNMMMIWWIWTTPPVHKMQSTFAMSQHPEYTSYRRHTQVPMSP